MTTATMTLGSSIHRTRTSSAGPVAMTVTRPSPRAREQLARAEAVLRAVGRACSRVNRAGPLALANAEPDRWHDVPSALAAAVEIAALAHRETRGRFDPRLPDALGVPREHVLPWLPDIAVHRGGWRLHLGGEPVDLATIATGLAVRWAAAELADAGLGFLVYAGGTGVVGGIGPEGGGWRVGIEDPTDAVEPALVVDLSDCACATSTMAGPPPARARRTQPGAADRPAEANDLASVTVVSADPVRSTVLSQTLLLDGSAGTLSRAEHLGIAASWIDQAGTIGISTAMHPLVSRRKTHD